MKEKAPSLSEQLKGAIGHFYEDLDPKFAVELVNSLLARYPYYSEALLFKARMLIADSRYDEAQACIETIKSIDHWNRIYIYDEAELLYRKDEEAATKYMEMQLKSVIEDIVSGISSFSQCPHQRPLGDIVLGTKDAANTRLLEEQESLHLLERLLDFCLRVFTEERNEALRRSVR